QSRVTVVLVERDVVVVVIDRVVTVEAEVVVVMVSSSLVVVVDTVVVVDAGVLLGATVTLAGLRSFTLTRLPVASVSAIPCTDSGSPMVVIFPLNLGNAEPVELKRYTSLLCLPLTLTMSARG